MPDLITSAAAMVEAARARFEEVETPDLIAAPGDPGLLVVDIRDVRGRQRLGFIPGSFHAPRGTIEFWVDPACPNFKAALGRSDGSSSTAPAAGARR